MSDAIRTTLWVHGRDSARCGHCGLAGIVGDSSHLTVPSNFIEDRPGCLAEYRSVKSKFLSRESLEEIYPEIPCMHIETLQGFIL